MTSARRPYSPSELASIEHGKSLQVAGRVLTADGAIVIIADATGTLRVELQAPGAYAPGLWLVVEGILTANGVVHARMVATSAGSYSSVGEFQRFARIGKSLHARQTARQAVREYFTEQGFLEVETPTRVYAPGTDVYLEPVPSGDHWLITSPEFHLKRLLVGGCPRVFEFARCFREDEQGPWHESEFTLLEWYRSFEAYASVMTDTERLIEAVRRALQTSQSIHVAGYAVDLCPPFERLTTREVFTRYAGVEDVVALAANDETRYFETWLNDVEPALASLGRPVFVTEFPLSQAALARPTAGDPETAERFELFVGPVELCNGYGELQCPRQQRSRFEHDLHRRAEQNHPRLPIDEPFLSALEEGLPPAAGNALGFDRLLALLLQQPIQSVITFPHSTQP